MSILVLVRLETFLVGFFILIIPLLFSGRYTSVYETPKMIWLTIFALILSVINAFRHKQVNRAHMVFLFAFFILFAVNMHFSMFSMRSLFGDTMYNDSWISFLAYLGIMSYFIYSSLKSEKVVKMIVFSGFILGIITILHYFLIFFDLTEISYDGRVTATIGQSNILGGILAGCVPLSWFWLKTQPTSRVTLFGRFVIFFVLVVATFMTMSRGAMLGLGVFSLIEIFNWLKTPKKRTIFTLILLTLAGIIIFSPPIDTQKINLPYSVERLLSFKDRNGFYDPRFEIWEISTRAIKDRFWFGYGNSNFQNAYQMYVQANDTLLSKFNEVESSHNLFVDVLVEWGFFGFLLLAIFLFYLFSINVDKNDSKQKPEKTLIYYLKLSVLVVLIKGMFEFYSVVNWLYLFIFFGLLFRNSSSFFENLYMWIKPKTKIFLHRLQMVKSGWINYLLPLFILMICIISAIATSQIAEAEAFERLAKNEGDANKVIGYYKKSFKYNPYRQTAYDNYLGILFWSNKRDEMRDFIFEKYPIFDDAKSNFYLGFYYLPVDRDSSIEYFTKASLLNTRNPQTFHYLGLLYYQKNDLDNAFNAFMQTVLIDRKNFSDDYVYLADIEIKRGNKESAKDLIRLAAPSENKNRIKSQLGE